MSDSLLLEQLEVLRLEDFILLIRYHYLQLKYWYSLCLRFSNLEIISENQLILSLHVMYNSTPAVMWLFGKRRCLLSTVIKSSIGYLN
jgi:hypothetical protein